MPINLLKGESVIAAKIGLKNITGNLIGLLPYSHNVALAITAKFGMWEQTQQLKKQET